MSVSSEISRLTGLRNSIRTKLIALGVISDSSADLEDCYDGIDSITAKASATYTPTTSSQTISAGQYLSGAQTISGDVNLVATNIKSGVTIFGVTGTHEGSSYDVMTEEEIWEAACEGWGVDAVMTSTQIHTAVDNGWR